MSGTHLIMDETRVAGGVITSVVRRGEGVRAAVFLHGIGSNAASFLPLLEAMPAGGEYAAWDAPGYGGSTPLAPNWPLSVDYAAVLDGYLAARGLSEPVNIVAHSLGCLMGAAFARRHPGRVARLVLMAPALGYGVPRGGTLPEGIASRIAELDALGPALFAERRAPRLVHEPERHPAITAKVREAMAAVTPRGYGQAARMLASGDLIGDAAHLGGPVLVLNGADDAVTPVAGAARLFAALRARPRRAAAAEHLVVIADAGHAVSVDQTAAVAEAVSSFIGCIA